MESRTQEDAPRRRTPGGAGGREHLPGIVKGAAINLGGSLSLKLLSFGYAVLLARFLTTGEVGRYFLGLTIFQFVSSLSLFGLDTGMVRYVPMFRARRDPAAVRGVVRLGGIVATILGAAVALPLVLSAGRLSERVFHDPGLGSLLIAFAPAIPFFVVATVWLSGIQGLGKMQHRVYVRNLAEPLARFALTVAFFLAGVRMWGVILSFTLSTLLGFVLAYACHRRQMAPLGATVRIPAEWRGVLVFSLPQTFSRLLLLMIMWTDTLMLGWLASTEEVGLYSVATRTAVLGMIVVDAFNLMFSPVISDLQERGRRSELDAAFKSVTKWSYAVGWPVILILLVFPRQVLSVYGEQYRAAAICLGLLAASQTVNTITGPVGQMIIMSGRTWLNLSNNLGVAALNVGLNLIFIPRYGIQGAALATMLSTSLLNVVRLVEVRWLLGMQPYRLTILKPLFAGVLAGAAAFAVGGLARGWPGHSDLVLGGMVLIATYVGLLYLMGFDEDDRFVLARARSKIAARARGGGPGAGSGR